MDRQISVLHRKIQAQEISVEEAARAFERLRAVYRHDHPLRRIQLPSVAKPETMAIYHGDEPYLRDHQFDGKRILLGLTYASLALAFGQAQLAENEALQLQDLSFTAPMALNEGETLEVAIRAHAEDPVRFEAICRYSPSELWQGAASGALSVVAAQVFQLDPATLMAGMMAVEPLASIYRMSERIDIGDGYRTLQALYRRPQRDEALSRMILTTVAQDVHRYRLHPLVINSAFLTVIPLLAEQGLDGLLIPFGFKSLVLYRRSAMVSGWVHVVLVKNSGELVLFDASFYDDEGVLAMVMRGGMLKRLRGDSLIAGMESSGCEQVEDYLLVQLQKLGVGGISKKTRRRNLMDLGLASKQLLELTGQLARALRVELAPALFFEYPSLAQLAAFLWQEHGAAFAALLENPLVPEVTDMSAPAVRVIRDAHEKDKHHDQRDIAIIGMQGRFGEANDLDQFWQNLWQERALIKEVPPDHWDVTPWFDIDLQAHDRTYSKWGSFIDDVDQFDADFFHMSRREAEWMDPQVRLLLQSAYATAEQAGVIQRLRGSRTGVFIGSCFNEYLDKITELGLPMDPYIATGSGAIAANRLSFWFDLQGPSLMFNTACSSSLVALHAACASLRQAECEMALVGGSNLLLSSWHYRYFSAIRALSPTGRCHTFDARADGYVPGECVAMLLLKPLSRAREEGDPICGVIKGSAARHGGYTPSLTAPSVAGEENVIVAAWQDAGIDPRSLSYIEAHGTGTALGDPIEINALKRAFARYTPDRDFCHIGSVKANIGHTEGAAGIAGVLKVLQQMKYRRLPALAGFHQCNPQLHLEDSPLMINAERRDWPDQAEPRRAGVSAFGFSGMNAHVVLEEYRECRAFAVHQGETVLVPLSARDDERLREQAKRLLAYLSQHTPDLAALAYTLQIGREAMAARMVFLVESLEQLRQQLPAFIEGAMRPDVGVVSMTAKAALTAGDLRQLAALWLASDEQEAPFDWACLYGERQRPARIALPTYAFRQQRYWLDAPAGHDTSETVSKTVACYMEQWVETGKPEGGTPPARVICLLSDTVWRQQLVKTLHQVSEHTALIFVAASQDNGRDEDGHYRVDVEDPERLRQGLCQLLSTVGGGRVLYLWSLDDDRWIEDCRPIVALLQAMADTMAPVDRLLLAGRAHDALTRCYLESWIGIARSVRAIMPACPVEVAIDLPQGAVSDDAAWLHALWRKLSSEATGSCLFQGERVLRPELVPVTLGASDAPQALEQLNTLLITGGLGELGLLLAAELSESAKQRGDGALNLILNGRAVLSAAKQVQLEGLRHAQCRIFYVQADCTDRVAMAAALAEVKSVTGPIDGVVHAAGLQAGGSVFETTQVDFDTVLNAKVKAALVLDQVLTEEPLALICYFSSSSSQLGDMGACSYAMANRFQQAYARYVQAGRARRVLAINWPLWRDGGMGKTDAASTAFYLKSSGLALLERAEGLAELWRIVASDVNQVLVLAGEPEKLARQVAKINDSITNKFMPTAVPALAISGRHRPELKGLNVAQSVLWDVCDLASRPLKAPRHTLNAEANLADFGFDSISLAEYASLLSRHFGLKLTPELFFSHSTLAKIADYLLTQHRQAIDACYCSQPGEGMAPVTTMPVLPVTARPPVAGIAIIGMSGRFPGVRHVDELWRVLLEGREMVGEIPAERYDWRDYYGDPQQDATKTRCIWMGSVPGVDEFDPLFFEISPREAKTMDPRQRLLLQEAWNALEDAGIGPSHLAAQRVGMFVGVEEGDFQRLADEESLTSSHNGILASRLAYFLNLTGPVMAINTACSSALVALHQAASSLRQGDCEIALVAGVNLIFSPDAFIGMTQAGMLSPEGKCFAFDRRANGMVPGEAVCCVVLKPLALAEADGDPIYGVLRASGVNYDGKTNGITAPSGVSQRRLLEEVYQRAGIDTEAVEYIVTHGTGTPLGDPVEINALNDAFRGNRPGHCALTSTKAHFGHTFAASGLVSVISLLQAFRHEIIPASLHFEQENDYIQWQESPFYVNRVNQAWPRAGRDRERLGAVSAFGMSGTNAHVVLESWHGPVDGTPVISPCYLFVLSAKTAQALREKVEQLCAVLEQGIYRDAHLPSISYTLLVGRHPFRYRLAWVAADVEEVCYSLRQYLAGEKRPNLLTGEVDRAFAAQQTMLRYVHQLLNERDACDEEAARERLLALADFYRQGYDIDGGRLFAAAGTEGKLPPRLSLPAYPFARERYWPKRRRHVSQAEAQAACLHPLVQRNVSTLTKCCFASRFGGQETFLRDHRIADQLIFPGVAYLELAREAVARASALPPQQIVLRHVAWLRPLVFPLTGGREIELFCALAQTAEDQLSFQIYCQEGGTQQVYVQGNASLRVQAAPAAVDLAALSARCGLAALSHEEVYHHFEAMDFHYGPTFRTAARIQMGSDCVIGQLMGNALDLSQQNVLLPPGVLDGALHIAASRGAADLGTVGPAWPFALESLRLYGSVSQALKNGPLHVVATYGHTEDGQAIEKIDVQICDEAGQCLVQLEGFSTRRWGEEGPYLLGAQPPEEVLGCLIRTPCWQPLDDSGEVLPPEATPQLLLWGLPDAVVACVCQQCGDRVACLPGEPVEPDASAYQLALLALFERLQSGVRGGYLQLFVGQRQDDVRATAFAAMLNSAMLENPELKARLLIVDLAMGEAALTQTIIEQSRYYRDACVRVSANGGVYGRQWRVLDIDQAKDVVAPWRDGGVYAITGGAGGLGLIFAQHIVQSCRAPVLYLCGRSVIAPPLQARMEALQTQGARVDYRSLDVGDEAAVRQWMNDIYARERILHGVIHGAGVIRDGLIIHKAIGELEPVLRAKVAGIEALDQAIGERPLDFFLACSSQAALGNLGQADYAAANAYMDAFMYCRQERVAQGQRQGRSLSINWPLWRDGGMQLPAAVEAQMRLQSGMVPMTSEVGMQSLWRLLAQSALSQAWVAYGELSRLATIDRPAVAPPAMVSAAAMPNLEDGALKKRIARFITEVIADVAQMDVANIHPEEKFEAYGFDSIMAVGVTHKLEKHLGALPKTLLFEYVNIASLVEHFALKYRDHFMAMFGQDAWLTTAPLPLLSQAVAEKKQEDPVLQNAIAVIGLGGLYPGADDIDALWRNLAQGVDGMSDFPIDRWDHRKIFFKDRSVLGKSTCRNGSFIADVDKFDYSYFKMPKVYADHMSPEVRLFLQVAVHTFEDAGYSRETMLARLGGDVGVLVGTMANDYHYYGFERNVFQGAMASGSGMATIPMTVSYFYGLTGPSLFIDTMCSSSSTCIHSACRMLKNDETQMILAGGINLMYHPYTMVNTSQGNFTSITATSVNSYGVGADGTVIGEGVGAVLLKRLDRAIADRDHIYGVIKGSAITNAGERNGFNVPNPALQTRAIRQAMEEAHVHPATISYVEGHGSGTKLGDPIEVLGLNNAFCWATDEKQFCFLGSIKSNIGHLLAASGVAGLTKTLLQLKHEQIAPSLHAEQLNQDIDFADTPFKVSQHLTPWHRPECVIEGHKQVFPRRAGITSIAAGGMNAHMIVEESPQPTGCDGLIADAQLVFVFSVHKLALLTENLARFRAWLANNPLALARVSYTLQVGRNNLRNRLAIRVGSRQALLNALDACIASDGVPEADGKIFYRFQETESMRLPVRAANDSLAPMLEKWLMGDNRIDWDSLYTQLPLRVSLPAYCFDKVRCWYTAEGDESSIVHPLMFRHKLHPLVAQSRPTLEPEAQFYTDFVVDALLDYVYQEGASRRFSAFHFADVALAIPALASSRLAGRLLSVSCAFEHYIADWATVSGLVFRLFEVEDEQLELAFELCRKDNTLTALGFAVISPARELAALPPVLTDAWLDRVPADEVAQRLLQAGYDFSPYLDNETTLLIGHHGLLLESQPPLYRHNDEVNRLLLPPYVATTIDKALYLLLDELGLSQAQAVVRHIEQLCCYGALTNHFSVLLQSITLGEDELSFCCWVLNEQGQVGMKVEKISLYLSEQERAAIRRDHACLLSGADLVAGEAQAKPTQTRPPIQGDGPGGSEHILAFIQQVLKDKLGFTGHELGESVLVQDLGLDSIMVVQLIDSVNKRFGTKLMPELFYEKQRLGDLAIKLKAVSENE